MTRNSGGPALLPTLEQTLTERRRLKKQAEERAVLSGTVSAVLTVLAAAALLTTLLFPVFQIRGDSMAPTLAEGELVLAVKQEELEPGELAVFSYGGRVLIKRVIARAGQWVTVDETGRVLVDGEVLSEPYVQEPALGSCDVAFPFQVPEGQLFVMGDHRAVSLDSREEKIGCVGTEQLLGRVLLRFWPLERLRVFQ